MVYSPFACPVIFLEDTRLSVLPMWMDDLDVIVEEGMDNLHLC